MLGLTLLLSLCTPCAELLGPFAAGQDAQACRAAHPQGGALNIISHSVQYVCLLQAKTRKLAERRIPKEELEDMERRRKAEEAEDRRGMVATMR